MDWRYGIYLFKTGCRFKKHNRMYGYSSDSGSDSGTDEESDSLSDAEPDDLKSDGEADPLSYEKPNSKSNELTHFLRD